MSSEGIFMSSEMGSRVSVTVHTWRQKEWQKHIVVVNCERTLTVSKKCTILTKCKFIVYFEVFYSVGGGVQKYMQMKMKKN